MSTGPSSRPKRFIRTNVQGTFTLLDQAQTYWSELNEADRAHSAFCMFRPTRCTARSGPTIRRSARLRRTLPTALMRRRRRLRITWRGPTYHTFGLPVLTTNCSNNYGPFQFPEKLIPLMILNALEGKPLPVYGDGKNVRDWLFVEDHCAAIRAVLESGRLGETYNIGGNSERANIDVVTTICDLVDEMRPRAGRRIAAEADHLCQGPARTRPALCDRCATKSARELGWRAGREV